MLFVRRYSIQPYRHISGFLSQTLSRAYIYIYCIHSHTPNVLFVTFLNKNRPCWVIAPKLYIYLFFHYFLPLFPPLLMTKFVCPFPSFSLTIDREVVDGSSAGRCLYNLYVPRCSRPEGFYHITGSLAPGVNNVEKWIQHFWTVFMGSCFSLLLFSFFYVYIIYIYISIHTRLWKMSSAGHSDVSAREIPVIKSLLCLRGLFFSIQHGNH